MIEDRALALGALRYARGVAARLVAGRLAGDALNPSLPQSRIAARLSRAYQTAAYRLKPEKRSARSRPCCSYPGISIPQSDASNSAQLDAQRR